jgi:hypothetical protein
MLLGQLLWQVTAKLSYHISKYPFDFARMAAPAVAEYRFKIRSNDFWRCNERASKLLFSNHSHNVPDELLAKPIVRQDFVNQVSPREVSWDGRVLICCLLCHYETPQNTVCTYSITVVRV